MQDLTGAQSDLRISSSQLQASSVEFSLFTMSMGSALLENFGAIVARASLPARSDTIGKYHSLACPSSFQAA